MPRWVPLLVVALAFGLAGGFELRALVTAERIGPLTLEHGEPIAVHPDIALTSRSARARRVGPLLVSQGTWLAIWEARDARRHDFRVEVRSPEGRGLWARSGASSHRRRPWHRPPWRSVQPLGLFDAPGGPLHFDLHVDPPIVSEAPDVRVYLIPAGNRLVLSSVALFVGLVLGFFGLREAWRANELV